MQIIAADLERALRLTDKRCVKQQAHRKGRRRQSIKRGVHEKKLSVTVRMEPDLKRRLDAIADRQNIALGVVLRCAVDFYLGMAEQEGVRLVPTTARKKT